MTLVKVWNTSNHEGRGSTLILWGKKVDPGGYVRVEEARVGTRLLSQLELKGMVHVGSSLPSAFVAAKGRMSAKMPPGSTRGHLPKVPSMPTNEPTVEASGLLTESSSDPSRKTKQRRSRSDSDA